MALIMIRRQLLVVGCLLGVANAMLSQSANAIERNYNIVTANSSITISGTIDGTVIGDLTIQPQGTNSLTTSYAGTIKAERGSNAIQFIGGSVIDANLLSGTWQPKAMGVSGSEAAEYAGKVPVPLGAGVFAGRNFVGDINSAAPISISGGSFDLSSVGLEFLTGLIDYRITSLLYPTQSGQSDISGQIIDLSGNGTISTAGLTETLTIPVNANLMFDLDGNGTANLTFTGSIKATATLPPPVPGDFDGDYDVDAADFAAWQSNFPKTTGGTLAGGDADGDKDIDGADFVVWQTHFPTSGSVAVVPEPASVCLAMGALVGFLAIRRLS